MSGQPLRLSELLDALNSDPSDTSLSTANALIPFRRSYFMLQSHLAPPPASRSITAATYDSEPLGDKESITSTSHQKAEQQAAVNAIEDHHLDVREGEALEASELSHQRGACHLR